MTFDSMTLFSNKKTKSNVVTCLFLYKVPVSYRMFIFLVLKIIQTKMGMHLSFFTGFTTKENKHKFVK